MDSCGFQTWEGIVVGTNPIPHMSKFRGQAPCGINQVKSVSVDALMQTKLLPLYLVRATALTMCECSLSENWITDML